MKIKQWIHLRPSGHAARILSIDMYTLNNKGMKVSYIVKRLKEQKKLLNIEFKGKDIYVSYRNLEGIIKTFQYLMDEDHTIPFEIWMRGRNKYERIDQLIRIEIKQKQENQDSGQDQNKEQAEEMDNTQYSIIVFDSKKKKKWIRHRSRSRSSQRDQSVEKQIRYEVSNLEISDQLPENKQIEQLFSKLV